MKKRSRRGLGHPPDVHLKNANEHLYKADQHLRQALKADNCETRVQHAIEAFGQAVAAEVEGNAGGYPDLGQRISLQAVVAIRSCVPGVNRIKVGERRFKLIRGGKGG